jgi:hypothetical protein
MITIVVVLVAALAAWLLIPKKKVVDRSADPLPAPLPAQNRRNDPPQSFRENALPPHAAATEEKLAIVNATIRERYAKKFRKEVLDELKELTGTDD